MQLARNLIAALLSFALVVAVDFLDIRSTSFDIDTFIVDSLSLLVFASVPALFWLANKDAFKSRRHQNILRLVLSLVLAAVFAAVGYVPFLFLHTYMGGTS
jgi:hypothetical protein